MKCLYVWHINNLLYNYKSRLCNLLLVYLTYRCKGTQSAVLSITQSLIYRCSIAEFTTELFHTLKTYWFKKTQQAYQAALCITTCCDIMILLTKWKNQHCYIYTDITNKIIESNILYSLIIHLKDHKNKEQARSQQVISCDMRYFIFLHKYAQHIHIYHIRRVSMCLVLILG